MTSWGLSTVSASQQHRNTAIATTELEPWGNFFTELSFNRFAHKKMPGDAAFQIGLAYTGRAWKRLISAADEKPCSFFVFLRKNWGAKVRRTRGSGRYCVYFLAMCNSLFTAAFHEHNSINTSNWDSWVLQAEWELQTKCIKEDLLLSHEVQKGSSCFLNSFSKMSLSAAGINLGPRLCQQFISKGLYRCSWRFIELCPAGLRMATQISLSLSLPLSLSLARSLSLSLDIK